MCVFELNSSSTRLAHHGEFFVVSEPMSRCTMYCRPFFWATQAALWAFQPS